MTAELGQRVARGLQVLDTERRKWQAFLEVALFLEVAVGGSTPQTSFEWRVLCAIILGHR